MFFFLFDFKKYFMKVLSSFRILSFYIGGSFQKSFVFAHFCQGPILSWNPQCYYLTSITLKRIKNNHVFFSFWSLKKYLGSFIELIELFPKARIYPKPYILQYISSHPSRPSHPLCPEDHGRGCSRHGCLHGPMGPLPHALHHHHHTTPS